MERLSMPKIIEFIQKDTLPKGRVRTTIRMFMLDEGVIDDITSRYARGESSIVECREGVTIKHPKDKYDKKIAKEEATKKLQKKKYKITAISIVGSKTTITLLTEDNRVLEIVKDQHGVRVYANRW